jgi:hypothetical protein
MRFSFCCADRTIGTQQDKIIIATSDMYFDLANFIRCLLIVLKLIWRCQVNKSYVTSFETFLCQDTLKQKACKVADFTGF